MPNPKLRFRFHEPDIDTNLPLTDGTVMIEGFELESIDHGEADAWDCGFGALMRSKVEGEPWISIPAFPNRKFRLSYIQVNAAAGIRAPKDLEGKRVGISGWSNTAGIWARGALQNYYGVELSRVDWRSARAATVPGGITIRPLPDSELSGDALLDHLLCEGELDAVIGPNVLPAVSRRDPRVGRLFRDYKNEEQAYFKTTGIFPISHVVTFRREFVEAHPDAPTALLKGYRQARDVAFDRIEGSDPVILTISWASAAMAEQRELMGDHYWAYNVADNQAALQAMMRFAYEQGITPTELDYQTIFDETAASLPGW